MTIPIARLWLLVGGVAAEGVLMWVFTAQHQGQPRGGRSRALSLTIIRVGCRVWFSIFGRHLPMSGERSPTFFRW